ncbi:MAG: VWA domain-containing protein [Methanotrichaceae archaeon]|nr:VWA domain-containing protein [Methanotrichaceae archaeon]
MIEGLYFSRPQLLLIVPLFLLIGLLYTYRKVQNRLLAASRIVIISLIIIAAANPYVVRTSIEHTGQPELSLLDDKTSSMEVFDPDTARRLNQVLGGQIQSFSGDVTPLGDKIIQYATPGNALVLVSDGNSNTGRPLDEGLALARSANASIFAIQMDPIKDDASIEISGTNTAVVGGNYPFSVIVRSSGTYQGPIQVYADNRLIYSDNIVTNRSSSIKIGHDFTETGSHILKASIAPDRQPLNNEYQKAVYVVPKPEVLLVSETDSPLAELLSELYELTKIAELPEDIKRYKAVILDDISYSKSLDKLKDYVSNGGGLIVVGGANSYELGGYYNSSLETAMPVLSIPSKFEGGKIAVIILDISFSLLQTLTKDGKPLLDYEKAIATEILKSPDLKDYAVGVVVFGTKAYQVVDPLSLSSGRNVLDERIAKLSPTGTENTHLDKGLELAMDMLNKSGGHGEFIVLSDGNLWNYPDVFQRSIELIKETNASTRLIQVQAYPGASGRFEELATKTGSEFIVFPYPQSLTTKTTESSEKEPAEKEQPIGFPISVINRFHYITSDLDINSTITGFNDVTPKPGSQRLVAMDDGKPVLTTWRYGLGRVAALSTDDGKNWASSIYAKPNSKLISSMANWAIGDPRSETNRVEAGDGWMGTSLEIGIMGNARPTIEGANIEKVGEQRYKATLIPDKVGIYYIGDYGVAVNYPVEYRDVGYNANLSRLIMLSGGKIFTEDEAKRSLIAEASRISQRTIQERISRQGFLLLAALIIFITELLARRLNEIRRRGRLKIRTGGRYTTRF